jgi:hypothetical protein
MTSAILAPAAALVLWSVIVMYWVMFTRMPAFKKAGVDLAASPPGGRYVDVEASMPERVNWVSHNHTHLMEQPTLFYAVALILAVAGDVSALNLGLAWGYVGLRVLHSLWQILVNSIPVRFTLFFFSSLCLTVLAVNAFRMTVLGS